MPIWPLGLPQLVAVGGYEESPPETLARTDMDAGPAKQRRRFTAGVRPVSAQLDLTPAQVDILDGFYRTDLQDGALSFDWVHPRTQVAARLRFAQPPAYRPAGSDAAWRVALRLEILP